MLRYHDLNTLCKNPAITDRLDRINGLMIRGLAFGLMLGIVSRAAWDHGIVAFFAQSIGDVGAVLWIMLRDMGVACWDFLQFIIHQTNH